MRLIDADAVKESIKKQIDMLRLFSNDELMQYADVIQRGFFQEIDNAPTIEPRGEWEEIEVIADAYDISGVKTWASKMKCDQCGFTTTAIEGRFLQYNFCPNCGADMR